MDKKNSGITLVALVITIIVLLIIAGVSVGVLLGDNGILSKSQEAANKDYLEGEKEEIKLQISEEIATNEGASPTNEVLKSILEKYGQVEYESNGTTVKGVITTKNGYEILLSDLGTLNTSSINTDENVTISYEVKGLTGNIYNILVKIGDSNGIETIVYKNSSGEDVTLTCDNKQEVDIDYTAIQDADYYFTILSKTGAKVIKDLHFVVTVNEFSYTGNMQSFTVHSTGTYLLETWGSQGSGLYGGKGGYAKGEISLTAGQLIYIYVGGTTGFNQSSAGGGNSGDGTSGGGGTDIRISGQLLSNRVIAAGGGGTGGATYTGGAGGGITGLQGGSSSVWHSPYTYTADGGAGGTAGGNKGGNGGSSSYYGPNDRYYYVYGGGGGGSSYLGELKNSSTIDGNTSMTSPSGSTETGHSGDGYARITLEQ